jgi:ribosomal protein S18 acetylase RimI-like enzyme
VVGFGTVTIGGNGRHAQITPLATDVPVAAWLLEKGIRRAREAVDHPEVIARIGMHPQNEALRDLASSAGFELATTYHRMRIDHHGPLAAPEPPAKATLHRGAHDDTTRRAAHAVLTAAFSAQDGAAIRPYDEWLATHENRSGFDWSQLSLVEYDGQVVAASDCNHAFVQTDNCGYVGRIGVLPEARGRGLAKYLLRQAFATDAAAGLAGTLLHVDTNNPTAALNLYLSVGMHPDRESHLWEQVLQKQQPPGR